MKHIAIIPARNGSKSIPNKNLQKIKGKTLVERTIDSAKDAGLFDEIFVSTDIPVLLEDLSTDPTLKVIHRKEELATDDALMAGVVMQVLDQFPISPNDFLWLLQPTSPFRLRKDFEDIKELLEKTKAKSVISVKDVGSNHPNRTYTIVRQELKPLRFTNFENKQTLKQIYIRNGCFYVCQVGLFKRMREFYLDPCVPYLMPEERSINIDGPLDLILAQAIGGKGKA